MIADFLLILAGPAKHPAKTVRDGGLGQGQPMANCRLLVGLHDRDRTVEAQDRHAGVMIPWKSSNDDALRRLRKIA
jgi:hypothetical protein